MLSRRRSCAGDDGARAGRRTTAEAVRGDRVIAGADVVDTWLDRCARGEELCPCPGVALLPSPGRKLRGIVVPSGEKPVPCPVIPQVRPMRRQQARQGRTALRQRRYSSGGQARRQQGRAVIRETRQPGVEGGVP